MYLFLISVIISRRSASKDQVGGNDEKPTLSEELVAQLVEGFKNTANSSTPKRKPVLGFLIEEAALKNGFPDDPIKHFWHALFSDKASALSGLTKMLNDPDDEYQVESIVIYVKPDYDHSALKEVLELAKEKKLYVAINMSDNDKFYKVCRDFRKDYAKCGILDTRFYTSDFYTLKALASFSSVQKLKTLDGDSKLVKHNPVVKKKEPEKSNKTSGQSKRRYDESWEQNGNSYGNGYASGRNNYQTGGYGSYGSYDNYSYGAYNGYYSQKRARR